jgi:hypothetical protein
MKKYLQPAVIAALVVASLFLLSRSCGLSDKYKLARDDYRELVLITAADKVMSDARISELTKAIGQANETIVKKDAELLSKTKQLAAVSSQLDELIANEPVQPELESQPLVISLRKQVKTLTDLYSISTSIATLQSEEIDVLKGKCIALGAIGDEWRGQYEREHALRLSSEKLVVSLEKRVKTQGLLGKVKTIAIVTVAGGLAYSIFKKG